MMNGTIFLAKQKYEYKHLALYITFTYIKFIYVIALLQDTCILTKHKFLLGGGTRQQFSSEWKTHKDFVLEREDANFSTNIKFLQGGGAWK